MKAFLAAGLFGHSVLMASAATESARKCTKTAARIRLESVALETATTATVSFVVKCKEPKRAASRKD